MKNAHDTTAETAENSGAFAVERDFESPYFEDIAIEHRGRSKVYRFTEATEEFIQKLLAPSEGGEKTVDAAQFNEALMLATVTDPDGTPMTCERLGKMPRALAVKINMKALEVNGYGADAEKQAGEA